MENTCLSLYLQKPLSLPPYLLLATLSTIFTTSDSPSLETSLRCSKLQLKSPLTQSYY